MSLAVVGLLVVPAACAPSSKVIEVCSAAPSVLSASARAGSPRRLTVHGERFFTCRDTDRGSRLSAMRAIPLVLKQGGYSASLRVVDARGRRGTFTVSVPVPTEFVAGPAVVTASVSAAPVTLP